MNKVVSGCVLAAVVALQAGCASLAELEAASQRQKEAQQAAMLEDARQTCEKFGFKAESNEMAQCIQTEYNRARDRIEREEARLQMEHERALRESEQRCKKDCKTQL